MAKKSFILYKDQKEVIDELTDEQAGKLLKAIYEYNDNGKITLSGALKVIFIPFKNSFDRDGIKWEEISIKRSEAGKKHTGNQYTRNKVNGTSAPKMEQNGTNGTVSVSVSDSVNVSVNDSVSVNVSVPDTPDTVFQYSILLFSNYDENDLKKSSKRFFKYYKEKKWQGVNDWKEKLELWLDDDVSDGKIKEKEEDYFDEAGFKIENGRRTL